MKVIFRSNNEFAKKTLGVLGGAEEWLKSLSKYLSDEAILRLSLFIDKKEIGEASLDIQDKGLHIHAVDTNQNVVSAIDSVIHKSAYQLVKAKEKSSRNSLNNGISSNIDSLNLETSLDDEYNFIEAEQKLADKKQTSTYVNTMERYVDYLYGIKALENEIDRAETQLAVLDHILQSEQDTILYRDFVLLNESIKQLNDEINMLLNKKRTYKMNVRDENYVEEALADEFNLLNAKRKIK